MSKKLFFALTVTLTVAILTAFGLGVALHDLNNQYDKLVLFTASSLSEKEGLYAEQAWLITENAQLEEELTVAWETSKQVQNKLIDYEEKLARENRREQVNGLRADFALLRGDPTWKLWDEDYQAFLNWFVDGQPATWGNLGDLCIPVLYDQAQKGAAGSAERYQLLSRYVKLSESVLGETDKPSQQALEQIEATL